MRLAYSFHANAYGLEKEKPMPNAFRTAAQRQATHSSLIEGKGGGKRDGHKGKRPAAANPFCRRWDRVRIGFLLGGIGLGAVGAASAASFPYRYPAGLVVSVLWWGIFCGCLGASLGALPGLFTQRGPVDLSPRPVGAPGKAATGADIDSPVRPSEPGGAGGYLPSSLELPEKTPCPELCRILE
jgi:hypothetical protein